MSMQVIPFARRGNAAPRAGTGPRTSTGPATIIIFPGVRYERTGGKTASRAVSKKAEARREG